MGSPPSSALIARNIATGYLEYKRADPLSIYAVAEKTYVDGIPYWDIDKDAANQKAMKVDEARIVQKMIAAKNKGAATQRPTGRRPRNNEADEDDEFVSGGVDGVGK